MVINQVLRQIQMDKISLTDYTLGKAPEIEDIKRRLFIVEREFNKSLPDHYYHNAKEYCLNEINSLSGLLSKGIIKLSEDHLLWRNNLIYVKQEQFENWQNLLTLGNPLLYISSMLVNKGCNKNDLSKLKIFFNNVLVPNVNNSLIIPPFLPQMEAKIKEAGLYDLHLHLNGSTETDIVWQSFLSSPERVYYDCKKEFNLNNQLVIEQYEQDDYIVNPYQLFNRLKIARLLRTLMVDIVFDGCFTSEIRKIVLDINSLNYRYVPNNAINPLYKMFYKDANRVSIFEQVQLESLLYVLVIEELLSKPDKRLSVLFHYYLLIIGSVNKFLVQQLTQLGFEQFQKITMNGFRDRIETQYFTRFLQLNGRSKNNLSYLEGRFSVKNNDEENYTIVSKIHNAWKDFNDKNGRKYDLRLVGHFIKKKENFRYNSVESENIRYRKQRVEYWTQAQALAAALKLRKIKKLVTGIDAASNELDMPPEVFAPTFRFMRRKGIQYFTFHAGEDFHHLIGGLRAIYEASEFLEMRNGDRIGHGTAAGINPDLWIKAVGKNLYIRQGEWLDDLIFVRFLISQSHNANLQYVLSKLEFEISSLASCIYSTSYTCSTLIEAWKLRKYCPIHILNNKSRAQQQLVWSPEEWQECHKAPIINEAQELLRQYHWVKYRINYDKIISIEPCKILKSEHIFDLQNLLLKLLHDKEIVLEVLPTSNLRISFYNEYSDHHLWRWLNLNGDNNNEKNMPSIVIGTDDPGIFATNIYNEYCHIYNQLVTKFNKAPHEAMTIIKQLDENAKVYAFNK